MNTYYARKGFYKNTKTSRIVIYKKIGNDLKNKALPKPDEMWDLLEKMDSEKKPEIYEEKTGENG